MEKSEPANIKATNRRALLKALLATGALGGVAASSFITGKASAAPQRDQPIGAGGGADPTFSSDGVGLPSLTSDPGSLGAIGTIWFRSNESVSGRVRYVGSDSAAHDVLNNIVNADIAAAAAIGNAKVVGLANMGASVITAYPFAAADLANASVTAVKLGTITDGVTLDQSGAGSTLEVKALGLPTLRLLRARR